MPAELVIKARLTRDPEKKVTNSGKTMAVFGVANNERIQDPNTKEWSDGDPMFLDCKAWGYVAEVILEHLGRGDLVRLEGTLQQRWWEDKESGQKRSKFEMAVRDVYGSLRKKSTSEGTKPAASSYDDVPPF